MKYTVELKLNDFEDLKELRAAKADETGAPAQTLASVRKELKI